MNKRRRKREREREKSQNEIVLESKIESKRLDLEL